MKKSLSILLTAALSALSLFVLTFTSCEIGMGESVDLEAPELTITSPEANAKVGKEIVLEGKCHDNIRVTEVVISNVITGEEYGKAQINGDNWKIALELDEGEVELKCQAKDKAENISSKSIRTILLLVDETAPEGLSWYIDRGAGIQIPLDDKPALENTDLSLADNKYIPQNQEFTICGNFYDAMSIDTITLTLSENGQRVISKTVTAENKGDGNYIGDGKSIFAPSFRFTHDELVQAKSTMSSGKHYLLVSYYTTDEHQNSAERNLQYLLWYPESDYPGIQQSGTSGDDGTISNLYVSVGSAIPIHFFDDDELTEIAYDFMAESAFVSSGITKANIPERKNNFEKKETISGKSDYPVQQNAGNSNAIFYLLTYAKDINGKESARIIKTTVSDNRNPLIIIEGPVENTIPAMTNGTKFTIHGLCEDTSGCKNLKIAYIPGTASTADKQTRATELFNGINGATPAGGEILKTVTFPVNKTITDGWCNEPFSFEYDILTDFSKENAKAKKDFFLRVEDNDGNIVDKVFNVLGDSNPPVITISQPNANMTVCDYSHTDLTLEFKASKTSGLGIVDSKYCIYRKGHADEKWRIGSGLAKDATTGKISKTIPKATLKSWAETEGDVQPLFIFEAEDQLEIKATDQRTVVLSPLPVLEKVTVDKSSGTYPTGTKLTFQAKFSDSVKVTGTPRLNFSGITAGAAYAEYKSGSGTDTLSFEYTVAENTVADGVSGISCSGTGIDLNGGTIETGVAGTGNATITFDSGKNFWDSTDTKVKSVIKLDGVQPYISSVTLASVEGVVQNSDDNNYYCAANHDIILNVVFSENINISKDSTTGLCPVLHVGSFDFTYESASGNTAKFLHTVKANENSSGRLSCSIANAISAADMKNIKDSAGNTMKTATGENALAVVIDTREPKKPGLTGTIGTGESAITIANNKVYNKTPVLTITADSSDTDIDETKTEYSLDGGLSWNSYNSSSKPVAGEGSHKLLGRVADKAGNISPVSDEIDIAVHLAFPDINEISIAKNDGKYKKDDTVQFKVFLSDVVEPYAVGAATISFTGIHAGNTITRNVDVDASTSKTNKLVFTYTVLEGDEFKGVKISALNLGSIKDRYSNTGDNSTSQIAACLAAAPATREDLVLDGKAPAITSYLLGTKSCAATATDQISNASNSDFTITLIFDENLIKESGQIILQRKGTWAIPPVMKKTIFQKWYNKMSITDKEILMETENGDGKGVEKTDTLTGQPVGPYKKITHGLIKEDGKMIPDTETQYVLDFQYGLYESTGKVAQIRNALKEVGYDKHTVEVRNVTLSGSDDSKPEDEQVLKSNIMTIAFTDTIEDGQNWELIIPGNSLHDESGNAFAGFKASADAGANDKTFSLWSNKVATPVVRVDRYSHGMGAKGLNGTSESLIEGWTSPNATTYAANSGSNLKPLGYAKVRIDCETPDVTIYYKTVTEGTANPETSGIDQNKGSHTKIRFTNDGGNENFRISSIGDKTLTDLTFTSTDEGFENLDHSLNSVESSIGDISSDANRYQTARKDYVTSLAIKNGFDDSDNGYEGVFKTVIIAYKGYDENRTDADGEPQINIEGGTKKGGEPNVSGFPLRDATSDHRYAKNMYYYGNGFFAWVSYEIVSKDFAVLQHRSNYSSNYPTHSYGQLLYLYNYSTWE